MYSVGTGVASKGKAKQLLRADSNKETLRESVFVVERAHPQDAEADQDCFFKVLGADEVQCRLGRLRPQLSSCQYRGVVTGGELRRKEHAEHSYPLRRQA